MLFSTGILFALLSTILLSCSNDDEPIIPNEEELITTLTLTLVPDGGGTAVVLNFRDIDGDGGNAPEVTTAPLAANTTYNATISLLNEIESPPEDITEEVEEEDLDHQFFYSTAASLDLTIGYQDLDSNGNPVGIETGFTSGAVSQGSLTIILRHEPDKNAVGVSDGNIANAGGETDIEVVFDLTIE